MVGVIFVVDLVVVAVLGQSVARWRGCRRDRYGDYIFQREGTQNVLVVVISMEVKVA